MDNTLKTKRGYRKVTSDTRIRTSREKDIAQRIKEASRHIMEKNDQIYKELANR